MMSGKKKQDYVTRDEFKDNKLNYELPLIFLTLALVVTVVFLDGPAYQNSVNLRSLELSRYTFNESECVVHNEVIESWICNNGGHWLAYDHNLTKDFNALCYAIKHTECSLYCHTAQIPLINETTGKQVEECKTREVVNTTWIGAHCWSDGTCITSTEDKPFLIINQTTCTPLYTTERTFCATQDEIAKVRSLIA